MFVHGAVAQVQSLLQLVPFAQVRSLGQADGVDEQTLSCIAELHMYIVSVLPAHDVFVFVPLPHDEGRPLLPQHTPPMHAPMQSESCEHDSVGVWCA